MGSPGPPARREGCASTQISARPADGISASDLKSRRVCGSGERNHRKRFYDGILAEGCGTGAYRYRTDAHRIAFGGRQAAGESCSLRRRLFWVTALLPVDLFRSFFLFLYIYIERLSVYINFEVLSQPCFDCRICWWNASVMLAGSSPTSYSRLRERADP